jgi:hypothetical protein
MRNSSISNSNILQTTTKMESNHLGGNDIASGRSILHENDKIRDRKFKVKNTNSRAINSRSIEIIKKSLINNQD